MLQIYLETIDHVIKFFGVEKHGLIASFVVSLLLVKSSILVLMGFCALSFRWRRIWTRRNNTARETKHREAILGYAFESSLLARKKLFKQIDKSLRSKSERHFVRRLIIAQLKSLVGLERENLVELYIQLKLLEEDLRQIYSGLWWRRLEAVIRIERLNLNQLYEEFSRLSLDENEMVALVSLRAMSRLQFVNKTEIILDRLSRRSPDRKDMFLQILQTLGRENEENILSYLETCFDPFIASLCVEILGRLQSASSVDYLTRLLRSSHDGVVESTIEALAKIKDIRAIPALENLSNHSNLMIQTKSVLALIQLGEKKASSKLGSLYEVKQTDVQRLLFESQRK